MNEDGNKKVFSSSLPAQCEDNFMWTAILFLSIAILALGLAIASTIGGLTHILLVVGVFALLVQLVRNKSSIRASAQPGKVVSESAESRIAAVATPDDARLQYVRAPVVPVHRSRAAGTAENGGES